MDLSIKSTKIKFVVLVYTKRRNIEICLEKECVYRSAQIGVVQTDARDKTRKVVIEYRTKHPKYGKFHVVTTKFHAHDEKNECNEGDIVLDPFCGSGTAVIEARLLARTAVGRDLNPLAVALAKLKSRGSNREQREAWLDATRDVCEAADRRRIEKVPPTELYPSSDLEFSSVLMAGMETFDEDEM